MFIAHLPAGYLLARRIARRLAATPTDTRRLMAVGLAGSILPDIDLVYFYLIDERQTLHHEYWPHIPAFWPAAMLTVAALAWPARVKIPWREGLVFLAGIFLHLILDTATGGIAWGWPVTPHSFRLTEVPARFDWWVWSFVLHWTFLAELAVVGWAAYEFDMIGRFRDFKQAPQGVWSALTRKRA